LNILNQERKRTCDSDRQQKATSAFQPSQGSEAEKSKNKKINLSLKNTLQNNKNSWTDRKNMQFSDYHSFHIMHFLGKKKRMTRMQVVY
jgi:hypothetical protein